MKGRVRPGEPAPATIDRDDNYDGVDVDLADEHNKHDADLVVLAASVARTAVRVAARFGSVRGLFTIEGVGVV